MISVISRSYHDRLTSNVDASSNIVLPELDTMIVRYSPVILEENPRRKPLGFVVVKPTRIFSAIVDRKEPSKSYLMIELARKLTPISIKNMFNSRHEI